MHPFSLQPRYEQHDFIARFLLQCVTDLRNATHLISWLSYPISPPCPVSHRLQPIYWQYDCAMSLYPLPHAVVVADSSPQAAYTHEGCTVFNPGSFAEGLFAAYKVWRCMHAAATAAAVAAVASALQTLNTATLNYRVVCRVCCLGGASEGPYILHVQLLHAPQQR